VSLIGALSVVVGMFLVLRRVEGDEVRRKIPMIGIVAAIMLLGMSVPLGIVPVHLSLAVLSGILLGPGLGFVAVFVVNLLLALVAHGGITLVGLNTLIVGAEVFVGFHLFKAFSKKFSQVPSTVLATSLALLVSMTLMVSMVGFSVGFDEAIPHFDEHGHEEELLEGHIEENHEDEEHEGEEYEEHHDENAIEEAEYLFLTGWAALIMILAVGNLLESFGTAYIIRFFTKIRPDLIHHVERR